MVYNIYNDTHLTKIKQIYFGLIYAKYLVVQIYLFSARVKEVLQLDDITMLQSAHYLQLAVL